MRRAEMRELARRCRDRLQADDVAGALALLGPLTARRTPFSLLDLAGQIVAGVASRHPDRLGAFLDGLAAGQAEGAWPLIGSALAAAYLPDDLPHAFAQARRYMVQADVWYATDTIAERVLGEGLRADFDRALELLEGWREEDNAWLRRAVGVAVHRYAKRERERPDNAARLLDLLAPLFEERDTSALKGAGWGIKTIGRYYPALLIPWLREQVTTKQPRKPMVRKAATYLPEAVKEEMLQQVKGSTRR